MDKQKNLVNDILEAYHNPKLPGAYSGLNKAHDLMKSQGIKVSKSKLKRILEEEDEPYSLYKPIKRKKLYNRRVVVGNPYQQLQVDLEEMPRAIAQSKDSKGYKYALTAIDVFTKFSFIEPLKSKSGKEVAEALEKIILSMPKLPLTIQSDKGKEFLNKEVNSMLEKHNVDFFTSENPEIKAGVVERLNLTLKVPFFRKMRKERHWRWFEGVKDFVDAYNHTKHSAHNMRPVDVNFDNAHIVRSRLYEGEGRYPISSMDPAASKKKDIRPKFNVGEYVRTMVEKNVHGKAIYHQFSEEIFRIRKILDTYPVTYELEDITEDRNPIKGTYYEKELQHTKLPTSYAVEILDKRTRKRKKEVLVHFVGYPKSEDRWIPEKELINIGSTK